MHLLITNAGLYSAGGTETGALNALFCIGRWLNIIRMAHLQCQAHLNMFHSTGAEAAKHIAGSTPSSHIKEFRSFAVLNISISSLVKLCLTQPTPPAFGTHSIIDIWVVNLRFEFNDTCRLLSIGSACEQCRK